MSTANKLWTDNRRVKVCEAIQKQATQWSAVAADRCIEAMRHDGSKDYERLKREAKDYLARDSACTDLARIAVTIINGMWPHAIIQRAVELSCAAQAVIAQSDNNTVEIDKAREAIAAFNQELSKE